MPTTPDALDFARRQAIRKADDAKQLDMLLKDMEASQASAPFANPMALDFARLRRELGV